MTQVADSEVISGNVKDIVNRLSRDMTNRVPFSVHQPQNDRTKTIFYVGAFAYSAKQPDELTFGVGDVIEFIEEVEDGWSKGKLRPGGQIGVFPTNFVVLKQSNTSITRPKEQPKKDGVTMRQTEPTAIERTPSTFLSESLLTATKPLNISKPASETPMETKEMARIKFLYTPQHPDELGLNELDLLINIISKDCGDAGWFEGELNGKKGVFPDNFIELVNVPASTESGTKYSSSLLNRTVTVPNKPPPANPPQPVIPPKPMKMKQDMAAPTTSAQTPKNSFAALREKMSSNLKVVAPEQVASVQQKPTEVKESNDSGDQVPELQHVTKSRARPPKSRPMSMVMSRNKSTDDMGDRLSSPTGSSAALMSASMFAQPSETRSNNSFVTKTPLKPAVEDTKNVVETKEPVKEVTELKLEKDKIETTSPAPLVATTATNSITPASSEFVPRAEFDLLLERVRVLEARLNMCEKAQRL